MYPSTYNNRVYGNSTNSYNTIISLASTRRESNTIDCLFSRVEIDPLILEGRIVLDNPDKRRKTIDDDLRALLQELKIYDTNN